MTRLSGYFLPTLKEAPADAEAASHRLMVRAGLIRQLGAGLWSYLPAGWRVIQKIERIIREEMDSIGAQEMLMPVLQPAELWQKTGRDTIEELFKLTDRGDSPLVLAMTHEENVTFHIAGEVRSYRDLPLMLYHIQTKERDEPRPRAGVLRTREFTMKDSYSFDRDEQGLQASYDLHVNAYEKIFNRCGLEWYMVESDVGMMGGLGAHEFMAPCEAGENEIALCSCGYAANVEVAAVDGCPNCSATTNTKAAIEVGNIFKLGTRYSEPLRATYLDEDDQERPVVMGSYGIGPARIAAAAVEQHFDERGISWPKAIAPFAVQLLPLGQSKSEEGKVAEALYQDLLSSGIEALIDDRERSSGEKFADAELLGCPLRVTVGKRSLERGEIELQVRRGLESRQVPLTEALSVIEKALAEID